MGKTVATIIKIAAVSALAVATYGLAAGAYAISSTAGVLGLLPQSPKPEVGEIPWKAPWIGYER